jgi:three-Cys-motif partner protein
MQLRSFGGPWTLIKLEVLEKYLNFYTNALKNKNFKLCYIDAFAGCGIIDIKGIGSVPGSVLRALDYPFDKYIFIEKQEERVKLLNENISLRKSEKNIEIIRGDCNELLEAISSYDWYKNYWRGVIFLDPYAMNLNWTSLVSISKTEAFDVWYLFPLSALNRVLARNGKIPSPTKLKITDLLGTDEWEKEIYFESPQLTLFGEAEVERVKINNIKKYVIDRLKEIFPEVSDKSKVLRNPRNNSPLFLLCFAVSNKKAIGISLKAADHILTHTDIE